MTKAKIWLIVAASLVAAGLIIFAGVMTVHGWDYARLFGGTGIYTNEHTVYEEFDGISIYTDTADITFVPSDKSYCTVECREYKNVTHTVETDDGTLKISVLDARKWYEMLFSLGNPKITVYLPAKTYGQLTVTESTGNVTIPSDFGFQSISITASTGDIKNFASASDFITIKTSTGDIFVEGISANSMRLTVSTGKITAKNVDLEGNLGINVSTGKTELDNVKCNAVNSHGNTGDVSLNGVVVTEKMSIERSTGDVNFDGCDAGEIYIKTDTGNVKGSLLSEKVFIVKTNTGNVKVPETVTGGKCKITTSTGDVKITVD